MKRSSRPSFYLRLLVCLCCAWAIPRADAYQRGEIIFPEVRFSDLTLREFAQMLRDSCRPYFACFDKTGNSTVNIVIDESRLTPAELNARISMDEGEMSFREVLHSVCKKLGVGYRIDSEAIMISSRAKVGLPPPPSRKMAGVPDGARKAYLVFVGRPPGEK